MRNGMMVLVVACLFGCPTAAAAASGDVEESARQATVRIRAGGNVGSGILTHQNDDGDTWVLTAAHVASGPCTVETFSPRRQFPAQVVGRDRSQDLACLRFRTATRLPFVPVCPEDKLPRKTKAISCGCSHGAEPTTFEVSLERAGREYVSSLRGVPGRSGGAYVTEDGIVAIHHGSNDDLGFAHPVHDFLQNERLAFLTEAPRKAEPVASRFEPPATRLPARGHSNDDETPRARPVPPPTPGRPVQTGAGAFVQSGGSTVVVSGSNISVRTGSSTVIIRNGRVSVQRGDD